MADKNSAAPPTKQQCETGPVKNQSIAQSKRLAGCPISGWESKLQMSDSQNRLKRIPAPKNQRQASGQACSPTQAFFIGVPRNTNANRAI